MGCETDVDTVSEVRTLFAEITPILIFSDEEKIK